MDRQRAPAEPRRPAGPGPGPGPGRRGDGPGRRFRRRVVADALAIPGSGAGTGVVDIGAGEGRLAQLLRRRHPSSRLLGLEPDALAVAAARRRVPDAAFRCDDLVDGSPPPTDLYAWATHAACDDLLGRVDEPEKLLWNARAYLSPGCRVVVTVTVAPGGRIATPADLHLLLVQAGFDVDSVARVGFPGPALLRAAEQARGRELLDADAEVSWPGAVAVRAADALVRLGPGRRSRYGPLLVAVAHEPR